MPKDKWFGLDQEAKDIWDQIEDKYKSFKKVCISAPSFGKPRSKPLF
jgi:hypothetical protein